MHHFHPDHLSRSSTKTIVGVRITGRRVSNRTFLHVLKATIHGSRKRTRDRPTSTTTFPNRLAAPKENRGRPQYAPTDRALPGHRSKARSAHDFPLHGGREASCTVPKKWSLRTSRGGSVALGGRRGDRGLGISTHALRLHSQKDSLSLSHGPRTNRVCPPSSTPLSRFTPIRLVPFTCVLSVRLPIRCAYGLSCSNLDRSTAHER
jgi:hypothetical protein